MLTSYENPIISISWPCSWCVVVATPGASRQLVVSQCFPLMWSTPALVRPVWLTDKHFLLSQASNPRPAKQRLKGSTPQPPPLTGNLREMKIQNLTSLVRAQPRSLCTSTINSLQDLSIENEMSLLAPRHLNLWNLLS